MTEGKYWVSDEDGSIWYDEDHIPRELDECEIVKELNRIAALEADIAALERFRKLRTRHNDELADAVSKIAALESALAEAEQRALDTHTQLTAERGLNRKLREMKRDDPWMWTGRPEEDDIESLSGPVLIDADDLRDLLAEAERERDANVLKAFVYDEIEREYLSVQMLDDGTAIVEQYVGGQRVGAHTGDTLGAAVAATREDG